MSGAQRLGRFTKTGISIHQTPLKKMPTKTPADGQFPHSAALMLGKCAKRPVLHGKRQDHQGRINRFGVNPLWRDQPTLRVGRISRPSGFCLIFSEELVPVVCRRDGFAKWGAQSGGSSELRFGQCHIQIITDAIRFNILFYLVYNLLYSANFFCEFMMRFLLRASFIAYHISFFRIFACSFRQENVPAVRNNSVFASFCTALPPLPPLKCPHRIYTREHDGDCHQSRPPVEATGSAIIEKPGEPPLPGKLA
jgi:hypothetical protein